MGSELFHLSHEPDLPLSVFETGVVVTIDEFNIGRLGQLLIGRRSPELVEMNCRKDRRVQGRPNALALDNTDEFLDVG